LPQAPGVLGIRPQIGARQRRPLVYVCLMAAIRLRSVCFGSLLGALVFACNGAGSDEMGSPQAPSGTAIPSSAVPSNSTNGPSDAPVATGSADPVSPTPPTSNGEPVGPQPPSASMGPVATTPPDGPEPSNPEPSATVPDVAPTASGEPAVAPSASSGGKDEPPTSAFELEFDVLWDFEQGDTSSSLDVSGQLPLELRSASVEQTAGDRHLNLDGEGSDAIATETVVDTSVDFSISAWVRLDQSSDFSTFVGVNGEQVGAVYLQKRSDGRLSFTTFPQDSTSASSCVATAEIQPRSGEWYHLVGTRSAATREQRIYVDGVLSGKRTCPGDVFAAEGGVSVGRGLYGGEPADWVTGAIDDIGLINRVLSPDEVVDLYRAGAPEANYYLFAYFVEVSQGRGDGLRLAHSHDGLHWGAIGAGKVFMPPSVGGGSFRDPHVMRDPDGVFHLVWTTTCVPWAESNCVQDRGLGHASSPDMVSWSEADYVEIDLDVEHVWAPETFFDASSGQYMVFWSSPLDQNPSSSDPHSIYYVLTQDFQDFSEPEVLYSQPGRNFIDATISARSDGYLMIVKDEADGQKNLRAVSSAQLFGSDAWTAAPSAPITGNYAAEGPSFLERNGELYVYFDKYGDGAYGAVQAESDSMLDQPSAWRDISGSVFFPGVRHGTPIEVPWDVFRAVALTAGE